MRSAETNRSLLIDLVNAVDNTVAEALVADLPPGLAASLLGYREASREVRANADLVEFTGKVLPPSLVAAVLKDGIQLPLLYDVVAGAHWWRMLVSGYLKMPKPDPRFPGRYVYPHDSRSPFCFWMIGGVQQGALAGKVVEIEDGLIEVEMATALRLHRAISVIDEVMSQVMDGAESLPDPPDDWA